MTIRYDFWSLIAALADGLQHDGEPLSQRAQGIADSLSKQPLDLRTKRENDLEVVVAQLVEIQKSFSSDGKTTEWRK